MKARQARRSEEETHPVACRPFSCSYTHFTGVGMGDLEGSPAFQGHPQGLCGTAHHPRGGGGGGEGGRRVMQDAPGWVGKGDWDKGR